MTQSTKPGIKIKIYSKSFGYVDRVKCSTLILKLLLHMGALLGEGSVLKNNGS